MELYECMQLPGKQKCLVCKTLEEEKNADVKLTEIAVSHINVDAKITKAK
jgi:ferritin-like metal-binding protein YciE